MDPYFAFFVQTKLGHILTLIKLDWNCYMTLLQSRCSLPKWKVLSSGISKHCKQQAIHMQATYLVAILPLIAGVSNMRFPPQTLFVGSNHEVAFRTQQGSLYGRNVACKIIFKVCSAQIWQKHNFYSLEGRFLPLAGCLLPNFWSGK